MYKLEQIFHTLPFTAPGDWQVSMDVNTVPEDTTGSSCHCSSYLDGVCRQAAQVLPRLDPDKCCTCWRTDPIRAYLEAKRHQSLIRSKMAFP